MNVLGVIFLMNCWMAAAYGRMLAIFVSLLTSAECGGTLSYTASAGIFSLDYPLHNADCGWQIAPAGASSITVQFSAFQIDSERDIVC